MNKIASRAKIEKTYLVHISSKTSGELSRAITALLSIFFIKVYIVGMHCLGHSKVLLMSVLNVCFYGEMEKITLFHNQSIKSSLISRAVFIQISHILENWFVLNKG